MPGAPSRAGSRAAAGGWRRRSGGAGHKRSGHRQGTRASDRRPPPIGGWRQPGLGEIWMESTRAVHHPPKDMAARPFARMAPPGHTRLCPVLPGAAHPGGHVPRSHGAVGLHRHFRAAEHISILQMVRRGQTREGPHTAEGFGHKACGAARLWAPGAPRAPARGGIRPRWGAAGPPRTSARAGAGCQRLTASGPKRRWRPWMGGAGRGAAGQPASIIAHGTLRTRRLARADCCLLPPTRGTAPAECQAGAGQVSGVSPAPAVSPRTQSPPCRPQPPPVPARRPSGFAPVPALAIGPPRFPSGRSRGDRHRALPARPLPVRSHRPGNWSVTAPAGRQGAWAARAAVYEPGARAVGMASAIPPARSVVHRVSGDAARRAAAVQPG